MITNQSKKMALDKHSLRDVIKELLEQPGSAMTTKEIVDELNRRGMYLVNPDREITEFIVASIVKNYANTSYFQLENNVVSHLCDEEKKKLDKKRRKKERNWSWDDFFEIINPENWGCGTKIALSVIILIIGVVVGMCRDGTIGNSGSNCSRSSSSSSKVQNSPYDASVHQVKSYLKRTLKDPGSYEKIEWGPVVEASGNEGYKYMVRHKYRAKNSYGGYVVEHQIFYLDSQGNVLWYEDIY